MISNRRYGLLALLAAIVASSLSGMASASVSLRIAPGGSSLSAMGRLSASSPEGVAITDCEATLVFRLNTLIRKEVGNEVGAMTSNGTRACRPAGVVVGAGFLTPPSAPLEYQSVDRLPDITVIHTTMATSFLVIAPRDAINYERRCLYTGRVGLDISTPGQRVTSVSFVAGNSLDYLSALNLAGMIYCPETISVSGTFTFARTHTVTLV